jgi:hypothetical protein
MRKASAVVVSSFLVVACGSSGTSAQNAAQILCDKICSCSATCTVASNAGGQEKDPIAFGTNEGCQNFYGTLLQPDAGNQVDPAACATAASNVQCLTDSVSGARFVEPPQACRLTTNIVDSGAD